MSDDNSGDDAAKEPKKRQDRVTEQDRARDEKLERERRRDIQRARRLKEARITAGFKTATEAARRLNVPESTYLAHENGSRGITSRQMSVYATAYGVNRTWLMFDENDEQKVHQTDSLWVRGVVQPGLWFEEKAFDSGYTARIIGHTERIPVIADQAYPKAYQYALFVQGPGGPGIKGLADPGEFLIAAEISGLEAKETSSAIPSDFYVIQRTKNEMHTLVVWSGEKLRAMLETAESLPDCWKATTSDKDSGVVAGEELRVRGLIIGKYTPRNALGRKGVMKSEYIKIY